MHLMMTLKTLLRDFRTDLADNRLPGGRVVCRFSTSCSAASDKSTQCSRSHAGTVRLRHSVSY